jgi:Zn-dependent oligopeptidase
MSTPIKLAFTFVPKPNLQQYRESWPQILQQATSRLSSLERPRAGKELTTYVRELDAFHLRNAADTNAEFWADLHPDQLFRDEAKIANKAATDLYSEALASSGIAANLISLEEANVPLDRDASKVLQLWKEDLQSGGAFLKPEEKDKLLHLNQQIEDCMQEFNDNMRNDLRTLQLDVKEISGVPDDYLANRTVDPSTNTISVTTKGADIGPIQEYCRLQSTREKVFRFAGAEASPINENVLQRLLKLRHERAVLLGLPNAAAYEMQGTMAGNVDEVTRFLDEVHDAVRPRAEEEKSAVSRLLQEVEGIDLQPWDMTYGLNQLKSHRLPGFDLKASREYFQVDNVFPALQRIGQTLFKLRFVPLNDIEAWHPSVTAALVYDHLADGGETLIGRIFFDIYPREGKVDGAAAYTTRRPIKDQQLGEVVLYANMPAQEGACMSYREVQTILHELGHCAHALLSTQSYDRLSGIDFVPMDFIESPSQMLELWLTDASSFDFAVNAQ